MIACLAFSRGRIVNICTDAGIGREADVRSAWDDSQDDDEVEEEGTRWPDEDPDWGFDNEETDPEEGDFWLDSDDEEEPL